MMPSRRESTPECGQRLRVGDRLVAGAAAVAQVGVLRAGAGVVKAGGDRVGLDDLALLVLHHRRERAVQHAGPAADRQWRAVALGVDALAASLHADQLHVRSHPGRP